MNFVFFFPDEMSASSVSCYGNSHVQTPNMDKIASEGVRFEHCIVQNPVCSPSRCSMMTGTYVHNHGHRTLWHLLQPEEPSLFRYLKNSGYDIAWFGKNDLYSDAYLDEVCNNIKEKRAKKEFIPSRPHEGVLSNENAFSTADDEYYSFLFKPSSPQGEDMPLDIDVGRGIDFLKSRKKGDKPFMLFLPIELPHPPYTVMDRFYNKYDPAVVGEDLMEPLEKKPSYEELIRKYRNLDKLPREFFAKIYAVYLGMVSYVDYLLGELNKTLEECGLADDTTVIISSDHGDWHGTRHLVEKWPNAMDDEIVRVPLIIKTPNGTKGHVVKEQTALFDIMPTILELAGIKAEHTHFAQSLVPQLQGANGDKNRAVFCEGGYDMHEPNCFEGWRGRTTCGANPLNVYYPKQRMQQEHPESVCRTTMIRTLEYKLVRRTSGENELYNLCEDPKETQNCYHDESYREIRLELEEKMLDWYQRTSDTVPYREDFRFFGH
ncbi:choline-sulfatase [Hydrogenoanaerobacterium saccharovorans]|uniref:Choline-sulfatase n=1 Tax=Hydrogenoanaerobacterium saccharovorans TaxID=474960 RepID=A0A1H7YX53_9FIRM|nr:sulfatase-like hydrolase/transferase [Hydrogenoanaerobacterium saccharovorans]RPF48997.1 choline-sulfatase [Hydrogenoanaerobacterium saccharovorans]SEM49857.1 choline-sulfatase [Hydrogenoanaerobacterium saccharovorans]